MLPLCEMIVPGRNLMDKKYKCDLCLFAQDYTWGTMMLTKDEYELVCRITNPANWDNLKANSGSGSFSISCDELDNTEVER